MKKLLSLGNSHEDAEARQKNKVIHLENLRYFKSLGKDCQKKTEN